MGTGCGAKEDRADLKPMGTGCAAKDGVQWDGMDVSQPLWRLLKTGLKNGLKGREITGYVLKEYAFWTGTFWSNA